MKLGFVLLLLFIAQTHGDDRSNAERLLKRTFVSLHRLLTYLYEQKQVINLDAVIGTRIVDGSLNVLLRHLSEKPNLETDAFYGPAIVHIRRLQNLADSLSNKAIEFIKSDTPDYYNEIGPIIAPGFWQLDFPTGDLDLSMVAPRRMNREILRENESDACLAELIGTNGNGKCSISDECWVMMTSPGYTRYSLTHEIFYLEVGIMAGCLGKLDELAARYAQKSTNNLFRYFCANILYESYQISDSGFPPIRRDLFMEQASLCGLAGFRQFFTSEFLEQILSWQLPTGCYGFSNQQNDNLKSLLQRSEQSAKDGTRMMKRYEKPLRHDCLSHRSAVAAGALAQYIRYMVEYLIKTK